MKLMAYGVIAGAAWLWIYQPFALAVCGGLLAGAAIGYGLRALSTVSGPSEAVLEADPTYDRLVGMGFRAEEVRPLLVTARAKGETDPAGYVMRSLIR